jgi:hypothetical protein
VIRVAVLLAVLCAAACAQLPAPRADAGADEAGRCRQLYIAFDRAVAQAGVADGGAARIAGFPYLRVDRPLASFAAETADAERFDAWVARMQVLDREARRVELANLSERQRVRLRSEAAHDTVDAGLKRCADLLAASDLATAPQRDALRAQASVPDDYDTWKRIVGLYWVTRIPFANGVGRYQAQVQAVFDQPIQALPVRGHLVSYVPPEAAAVSPAEVAAILVRTRGNPLGIPEPEPADQQRLFAAFAPVWVVDERDENDRIGALVLGEDARPRVDTTKPVVYRRLAYTRYHDQVLLQLVYSVWLPARPRASVTDMLGGHLDGVVWRVTLGPDGTPLVYDSIHHCGCYHQFFPTARAQPLPPQDTLDEQAFVPQRLTAVAIGDRVQVRLASGTHYIQRVAVGGTADGLTYSFAADASLRSLPAPRSDRSSAFGPDGIVPGSERGERYVLWPMGVREPGAMRQWGRHPTAFVGRRHFDEARLIERYFVLQLAPLPQPSPSQGEEAAVPVH